MAREYRHVIVTLPQASRSYALTAYYNHVYAHGGWLIVSVQIPAASAPAYAHIVLVTDEFSEDPPTSCIGMEVPVPPSSKEE